MEPMRGKEGWRCAWEDTGELCAVMDGQRRMHWLFADRLDMILSVSCTHQTYHCSTFNVFSLHNALPGPVPLTNASFGRGSGPVHMTSVNCRGDEEMLDNCQYNNGVGVTNCHHARDAGVMCTSKNVITIKFLSIIFFQMCPPNQVEHQNITPSKPALFPLRVHFQLGA